MSQRFLYIVPMSSREDRMRLNNAKIKLHFLFALYSAFFALLNNSSLSLAVAEDRMRLGIKIKNLRFCFVLHSAFFALLNNSSLSLAVAEDRMHLGIKSKNLRYLLCSPLGFHYLCKWLLQAVLLPEHTFFIYENIAGIRQNSEPLSSISEVGAEFLAQHHRSL